MVAVSELVAGRGTTGTSDTSGSVSPATGDLLVAWVACENGTSGRTFTMSNSGTDFGWTRRAGAGTAVDDTRVELHTAYVSAGASVTVTCTNGGSSAWFRWGVLKFTGHNESTFGGATSTDTGDVTTDPYTTALTLSASSSYAVFVWGDWNATTTALSSITPSPSGTEVYEVRGSGGEATVGCYYATGLSGSQNVGVTGFASGIVRVAALEVRDAVAAPAPPPRIRVPNVAAVVAAHY